MSWSSNNVNTSFVVLAFKHVCLSNYGGYECIPISPHCAWRTGIHSFCNMAKGPPKLWSSPVKKKRYSKNFWCSCLQSFIDVKDTMQGVLFLPSLISFWRPFFCTFALIWLQRKLAWTLFWQPFACKTCRTWTVIENFKKPWFWSSFGKFQYQIQ